MFHNKTIESRLGVLSDYYQIDRSILADLAKIPHQKRKLLCAEMGVHPHIFRTMMDYTRYPDAIRLREMLLSLGVNIAGLNLLDFGCLASDYGIFFARLGSLVTIYDFKEEIAFAAFRIQREDLVVRVVCAPCNNLTLMAGKSLVIFGEVLEHIDNPLEILQACVASSVTYIFTSCYPFGDDAYFSLSGHSKAAQALQPECLMLLRRHYQEIRAFDKAVLWNRIKNA